MKEELHRGHREHRGHGEEKTGECINRAEKGRNILRPYKGRLPVKERKAGTACRARTGEREREELGAEEDGFALEHFYGDEEGGGGVDAGGREDDGDEVPVIGAGDQFFAEQADVKDGNQGQLGG